MTAINMFRQRYRAAILTDAAAYDLDGILHLLYQKCVAIPHLSAAIACRGSMIAPSLFAAHLGSRFSSFDELIAQGAEFAESVYDQNFAALTSAGETEVQIFVAGWSQIANRPATYLMTSQENDPSGLPAWQFFEADACLAAPLPPAELLREQGFDPDIIDLDDIDPVRHGIQLMEAQRRTPVATSSHGHGKSCIVGGFALLTEIKAEGVSQRVIHRWPDRLGEKIDPWAAEDAPSPAAAFPLSRQQRRAWERQNKGAR